MTGDEVDEGDGKIVVEDEKVLEGGDGKNRKNHLAQGSSGLAGLSLIWRERGEAFSSCSNTPVPGQHLTRIYTKHSNTTLMNKRIILASPDSVFMTLHSNHTHESSKAQKVVSHTSLNISTYKSFAPFPFPNLERFHVPS